MDKSMIEPDGFQLLYEEGPCLVVAKPGGLATQAPPGVDSLEVRIKSYIKQRDQKPGKVYLGVPHRLDRPVSGVMVFTRHVRAARRVAEQFEGRTVEKLYLAAVEGMVTPDRATWTDYIRKVPGKAESEIVARDEPGGRIGVLHYRVLAQDSSTSFLAIQLETGRTHQIRVQAASRSHPVLGDEQYGSLTPFGPQTEDPRRRWIALHARSLRFRHPMTRETILQTAPLPDAWSSLCNYRGLIDAHDSTTGGGL
jgi:23S rRNA pseudouridine1911/1915/1917 synthase